MDILHLRFHPTSIFILIYDTEDFLHILEVGIGKFPFTFKWLEVKELGVAQPLE